MDGRTIEIFVARDSVEAHTVKAALADQGVPATVVGDHLRSGLGELPLGYSTAPRIWVPAAYADRAREVLAALTHAREAARRGLRLLDWICVQCGEAVDGTFVVCWSCEAARG